MQYGQGKDNFHESVNHAPPQRTSQEVVATAWDVGGYKPPRGVIMGDCMKEIEFIDDTLKGVYYFNGVGSRAIVDNWRASRFCKETIDWDETQKEGKIVKKKIGAIVIRDLGLHFGRSKHVYVKDGKSVVNKTKGENNVGMSSLRERGKEILRQVRGLR